MSSIYVIEIITENDVVTTHTFLSSANAYRKFIDLTGEYWGVVNPSILKIQLIKKDIDDETGFTMDTIIDQTDFRKAHENYSD